MKVRDIEIHSFRNIDRLKINDIPDFAVFVGPNGVGKSSILEAVICCLSANEGTPHLVPKNPIRSGEERASVFLAIETDEEEIAIISNKRRSWAKEEDIPSSRISVGIHPFGRVDIPNVSPMPVARKILQTKGSEDGLGSYDWFSPYREFEAGEVAAASVSDEQEQKKKEHRVNTKSKVKFLKQYLVNLHYRSLTGSDKDSRVLKTTYGAINKFLYPKRLLEPAPGKGGSAIVIEVETPSGKHSLDLLSSGEKEVLLMITDIIRLVPKNSIICIDEPDLHLHPKMQRNLIDVLGSLGINNQFLIATHSPDLVNTVSLDSVISLKDPSFSGILEIKRFTKEDDINDIYGELGVKNYSRIWPYITLFLEGSLDTSIWRELFKEFPDINFAKTRSINISLGVYGILPDLLEKSRVDPNVWILCDRDFLEEAEIQSYNENYPKLVILNRRMLENYLLEPRILREALTATGLAKPEFDFNNEEELTVAIKDVADALKEDVVQEWYCYKVNKWTSNYGAGWLKPQALRSEGVSYLESRRKIFNDELSQDNYSKFVEEKTAFFDNLTPGGRTFWDDGGWLLYSSGKKVIGSFLNKYCVGGAKRKIFTNILVREMVRGGFIPTEIKSIFSSIVSSLRS